MFTTGNSNIKIFSPLDIDKGAGDYLPTELSEDGQSNAEVKAYIEEQKKVNNDLNQAPSAVLNLVEDAIHTKGVV